MLKNLYSIFVSILMLVSLFNPLVVSAAPSPTTKDNNGNYYSEWDGKNIVLAPKGTQAYVNGQLLTSMGDGNSFMTQAGNVYSADGTFLYNSFQNDYTGNVSNILEFHFVRSTNDETAFDHFQYAEVDGNRLDPMFYTIRRGSVYLKLTQAFIDTLQDGEHTLTIYFDDSESMSQVFVVSNHNAVRKSNVAKTSDPGLVNYAFIFGGALTTALGTTIILRNRS